MCLACATRLSVLLRSHTSPCLYFVVVFDCFFCHQGSYDTELQALHELIQRKVVTLLSDPENIVKQTLLENGITQLCVFFGRQKANDVLLSHMITFLNDKQDWQLRGAFFDSIVGVAAYVGWQSLVMLRPLLEQVFTGYLLTCLRRVNRKIIGLVLHITV